MEEAELDIDFEDLILILFYLARIYFLNLNFSCQPRPKNLSLSFFYAPIQQHNNKGGIVNPFTPKVELVNHEFYFAPLSKQFTAIFCVAFALLPKSFN